MSSIVVQQHQPKEETISQDQLIQSNNDKINNPKPLRFSIQFKLLLCWLVQLIACIQIYLFVFHKKNRDIKKIINILFVYATGTFLCYIMSQFDKKLKNLKPITQFKQDYERFKRSGASLRFMIECFHRQKTQHGQGNKIVTRVAQQIVDITRCVDISGYLNPNCQQKMISPFNIVSFTPQYEFFNSQQAKILQKMFKTFIKNSKKDKNRISTKHFQFYVPKDNWEVTYTKYAGLKEKLREIYKVLIFVGLSWPAVFIFNMLVCKSYQVTILKRISIKQMKIQ